MHRYICGAIFVSFVVFAIGASASIRFEREPRNEPSLRFLRFERDPRQRLFYAVARYENTTARPIYYYGHDRDVPYCGAECRGAAGWEECGVLFCGSGAETYRLEPGDSFEFRAGVGWIPEDPTDETTPFCVRKFDTTRPVRVVSYFGFTPGDARTPVSSNVFRIPPQAPIVAIR